MSGRWKNESFIEATFFAVFDVILQLHDILSDGEFLKIICKFPVAYILYRKVSFIDFVYVRLAIRVVWLYIMQIRRQAVQVIQ